MSFCDMNVIRSSKERDKQAIVLRLIELGWTSLAWNTVSSGKLNQATPLPKVAIEYRNLAQTNQRRLISGATSSPIESVSTSSGAVAPTSFQQYSRITLPIDDMTEAQRLNATNPVLSQFDIVAVVPTNFKMFSYCCKTADIDMISIDFTHRVPYALDKKILDEAVKRGISFEITYSPLLTGQAVRKEVLSNTRLMVQYLRGKNVILTSGADVCSSIRGPLDAVNMGQILGIKREEALRCCRENCDTLLKHGRCRKLRFSVMEVLPAADMKSLVSTTNNNKRVRASDDLGDSNSGNKRDRVANKTEIHMSDSASTNSHGLSNESESESDSDNEAEQQQQLLMLNRKNKTAGKTVKVSNSVSSEGLEDDDGFMLFS